MDLRDRLSVIAGDLRYAVRQLRRGPGFAAAVVATFALGRFFLPEEDRLPVGAQVAVIGHGYWKRAFGARRDVLVQ